VWIDYTESDYENYNEESQAFVQQASQYEWQKFGGGRQMSYDWDNTDAAQPTQRRPAFVKTLGAGNEIWILQ
jgi:hypothetical protein